MRGGSGSNTSSSGKSGSYSRLEGPDGERRQQGDRRDREYDGERSHRGGGKDERREKAEWARRGDLYRDRGNMDERRGGRDRHDARRDGGQRGDRGGRNRDDGRSREEGGRREGRTAGRDAAAAGDVTAAADATSAPVAPVARPPGSSTGNRPLPYDLPLVRPDDGDKGTFFAGSSWRHVGAMEEVVSALKTLGISRPSHIQALAFSALCGTGSGTKRAPAPPSAPIVLADQAGSGKTLAYLAPLMQILRQEELAAGTRVTRPGCPRGIVVAPTVELVQQVLRVARALSSAGLRCRTAAFTGGQKDEKARAVSFRTQKGVLGEGVDLLVATPGRLQKHLQGGTLELTDCRMLVLDEVDVLMGDRADFSAQIVPLHAAAPPSLRFVLVTATLPQHVFAELKDVWPRGEGEGGIRTVFGPGLHRTAAGLVEELVDCSGGDEVTEESGRKRKLEALKTLLERHRAPRTLVFCNKIDACRDVENFLLRTDPQQQKYKVLPYHEAIRDDLRAEAMAEFLRPVRRRQQPQPPQPPQLPQQGGAARGEMSHEPRERPEGGEGGDQGGPALVLVATDRTSRGIDVLDCEHVILFDFPRDPSEYVRRVGRTARGAGGRGTVSSLVLGRQVPLAREIIERNQKGMPLHSLPE
ncbi:hypothetical protein VOLCADRAFT_86719 [Volvox carteri f. nagariensis]|uniref:Uncharacterized protein n=1 Tax=Volvox carteri f. nagariensis TaxID=3068 RepID=D8TJF2_VOLCA|nr:uncharacterized protein VOLCADRAFT_86719 [Volvox carteri f. nagariensis]EFJ52361.1 hypothetical protein VOLCADRAFT_86719 [Volvox carteri f. nagariensis]|eukprot:XP_002946434.1 hypothetical protein VOLCADRAFT_86719 [Volvox carteri f. nagariensis]